jgi:hypothetical protein
MTTPYHFIPDPVVMIDAPADSPITAAFDQAGFHEFDRQYELFMTL